MTRISKRKNTRIKGVAAWVKTFFSPLQVPYRLPTLKPTNRMRAIFENPIIFSATGLNESDAEINIANSQQIEIKKLEQERDVANMNLIAQHRLMTVTVLTALAALLSSSAAIYVSLNSKSPVINVKPEIVIQKQ